MICFVIYELSVVFHEICNLIGPVLAFILLYLRVHSSVKRHALLFMMDFESVK